MSAEHLQREGRQIGPLSAVLIAMGAMIGTGIFVVPHDIAEHTHSLGVTLALWGAGGLVSLLGALSFAELGAALPENGGLYAYLRRAYGPAVAFAFGWSFFAILAPASVGFFAQVTATYALALVGAPAAWVTPLAIAVVAALVLVNVRGLREALGLQNVTTTIKVAGLALVGLCGLLFGEAAPPSEPAASAGAATIAAALVPVLWAYDGWINVAYVGGEVRDPQRNLPRALIAGSIGVTLLYLAANAAYLAILGGAGVEASATPAADAAARALGGGGRTALSVLVGISTLGGCTVVLLTGSRVVSSVARDIFPPLAHQTAAGTPGRAIVAVGALSIVYMTSPLGRLGDVFVIGVWPFYAAGAVATVVLRRREPDLPRPHRTLAYPLPIAGFCVATVLLLGSYAIAAPARLGVSFGIIAVSWPMYRWLTARSRAR
ncbi:MAG TPA: amino acid permease [Kofleriaceae bacterium]|nr:amino acid permease [Kofleriaceae bacterium]